MAGELGGSRSKNLFEGVVKQRLVQGHTPRLLDEVREPGISSTRKPENQDSQHMLQRRQDDNKNQICVFDGGHWGQRGKNGPKHFFLGSAMTIKVRKRKFDFRSVVVIAPGEKRHININFLLWLTSRWGLGRTTGLSQG